MSIVFRMKHDLITTSFPRSAWECRPGRSASPDDGQRQTTRSVEDGIPTRSVGTRETRKDRPCDILSLARVPAHCRHWSSHRSSVPPATPPSRAQEARQVGEATKPLARLVPAKDLIFYAEFQGFDAHSEAWRRTAAYRLLNETKLGALLEDLAAQGIAQATKGVDLNGMTGADIVSSLERIASRGFVVAAVGKPPEKTRIVVVVRGGSRPDVRILLDRLVDSMAGPKPTRKAVRKGDRSITVVGEGDSAGAIWDEAGDTVVCEAESVDRFLKILEGEQESAVDHPIRTELSGRRRGTSTPSGSPSSTSRPCPPRRRTW